MDYKKDFDLFVGGKSGIFKGIKIEKKTCITKNIQNLLSITREHEVTAMSWGDEEQREILLGCGSDDKRSVKIYDTKHAVFSSSFNCDTGTGKINGISRHNDAIITAVESGQICSWRLDNNNNVLIEAGENMNRMRHSNINKNLIATGGKEHKLQLFDLETKKRIFEEKNVRHDWLELKVPLWISDIGFISNSSQIATCSRYGHVRLYDPDAQRRPVINLEIKDQALTTLAVAPKEKHIVVGSARGVMNLVDLRSPGKILNTYKDFAGSVTAISCTSNNPYIVSVGLDRYLRVHHLDTKQLLHKTYLTSRLSCFVLRSEFSLETNDDTRVKQPMMQKTDGDNVEIMVEDDDVDQEYDKIFDRMPVIANEENEANLLLMEQKKRKKSLSNTIDSETGNERSNKCSKKLKNGKKSIRDNTKTK